MATRPSCGSSKATPTPHGVEVTIILDLMHVLSYLWKAAQVFHPEDDDATVDWVRERLLAILQGRAGLVAGGMRRSATRRGFDAVTRLPDRHLRHLPAQPQSLPRLCGLPCPGLADLFGRDRRHLSAPDQ